MHMLDSTGKKWVNLLQKENREPKIYTIQHQEKKKKKIIYEMQQGDRLKGASTFNHKKVGIYNCTPGTKN